MFVRFENILLGFIFQTMKQNTWSGNNNLNYGNLLDDDNFDSYNSWRQFQQKLHTMSNRTTMSTITTISTRTTMSEVAIKSTIATMLTIAKMSTIVTMSTIMTIF